MIIGYCNSIFDLPNIYIYDAIHYGWHLDEYAM